MNKRMRDLKEMEENYGIVIMTVDPVDDDTIPFKCKSGTVYQINVDKRGVAYVRNVDDEGVVYVDRG